MKPALLFASGLMLCTSGFSQNVGIGTTNPVFKLDVRNGSINTDSVYRIGTITVLTMPGTGNLFVGNGAGKINSGSNNTFSGDQSGYANTTGFDNSFFGRESGLSNTTGNYNSFLGLSAGSSNTIGSSNSFFGWSAGYSNTTGNDNSFFGKYAGFFNTTGNDNSFFSQGAGYSNTTGFANCFFGISAGLTNNTGYNNSFFGAKAGYSNTSGSNNSFFGWESGLSNTTGSWNTFSGDQAGYANTGSSNSFFGQSAGFPNTTGSNNSFFGRSSGLANTLGEFNSFFGSSAGSANINGTRNTAVGNNANFSTSALSNATAIGFNAIANASNKIRLGNSSVTVIEGQVPYTIPSDGRFKTNVTETVKGLDFIMQLRPVVYIFQAQKMDAFISGKNAANVRFASHNYSENEAIRQSGFIAQEVAQAAKEAGYDFNGVVIPKNEKGTYSLAYSQFVVPLVKAVQEQQAIIEQQNRKIEMLMKEITLIKEKLK